MALLGTPPAINGISPPRRNSKLFGGLRREMGNCGLPSRGLSPWFLGGTQQIPRRLSPGNCSGGVMQSAGNRWKPGGHRTVLGFWRSVPDRYPPADRAAPPKRFPGDNRRGICWVPPTNSLRPSADCATPPKQFPGDNRRGICWVPPRNQGGRPHEGSPQFPISRRSPPKSFEFRRGGKTPVKSGGVPNKAIF